MIVTTEGSEAKGPTAITPSAQSLGESALALVAQKFTTTAELRRAIGQTTCQPLTSTNRH